MRILMFSACLVPILISAAPAVAQVTDTDQQRLEIFGTSPPACVLQAPTAANGVNATFQSGGPANGEIRIVQMVNPQTGEPVASSINILLPVICNSSHRMAIRSLNGGLLRFGGNSRNRQDRNGFADFVDYRLAIDWAGQSKSALSSTELLVNSAQGRAGEAVLSFELQVGGGALVAGRYSDTVVVEFQAAN